MKLRHNFCRGYSALSESLVSRTVDVRGLFDISEITDSIRTGPLESIRPSDRFESVRVSFLHRSSAVEFIKQLEPKDNLRARFGDSSPLYAGIISALLLHGASRSLRVFAKKPFHTRGLELVPNKFGASEGRPRYTAVTDSLPFVTCHYNDIADSIKAFVHLNHPPGHELVGHARFTNDKCDIPNHYSRPIRVEKKKEPQGDSEDSESVKPKRYDVKLNQRRVILHGIAPGTTGDDLERAVGEIGEIQTLALVKEKEQAVVSFMSPTVAHTFAESPDLHVINKRRVKVQREDTSPVNPRLAFARQLGLSRTIQLKTPDRPSALIRRLCSQTGVADAVALKDKLHWDFQAFGPINKVQVDEESHSINITFSDIYRASRVINYLAWPEDYPLKVFNSVPYRHLTISYAPPPASYILEESATNPDGVLPVFITNSGLRARPHKKADPIPKGPKRDSPLSMQELKKMVEESFGRLGKVS